MKACNYVLAVIVLGLLGWIFYSLIFNNAAVPNSIISAGVFAYWAFYFLKHGYLPYQEKDVKRELDEVDEA